MGFHLLNYNLLGNAYASNILFIFFSFSDLFMIDLKCVEMKLKVFLRFRDEFT